MPHRSQHPGNRGVRRADKGAKVARNNGGFPRHNNRGLSALAATLLVSLVLAGAFAGFASSEALRLRDAQATRLERWARLEARALHEWLHEAQERAGFGLPRVGAARLAGNSDNPPEGVAAHLAPWASAPRGFRGQYLVANPGAQANNPGDDPALRRAHGILVVSVRDPATVDGNDHYLISALCQAASPSDTSARRAEALARRALANADFGGPGCDVERPGRAVALFAAPLAGINEGLVLRAPRSGFAPPAMETDLDMGGHAISQITEMTISRDGDIDTPLLAPQEQGTPVPVSGNLTVEGSFSARHLQARSGEVSGTLDVRGQLATVGRADGRLDVTGWLGARRPVGRMTLTGPGPRQGVRSLSVRRCRPAANCRPGGRR